VHRRRRVWKVLRRALALTVAAGLVVLSIKGFRAQRQRVRDRAELSAQSTFFNHDGRRIRYRLEGEGNLGPTVVVISGFMAALEQWDDTQEAIAGIAPVLTYDRGGYGLSDPPTGYDADAQADELADLASLKGVKQPLVVVGFSSSALIACAFTRRHPELLGGLLLLDPTNPEHLAGTSGQDRYARRVLYERGPVLMAVKLLLGVASISPSSVSPTPAELRSAKILNFPSHWWSAYREGSVIGKSANEAELDWSRVKAPITLMSVASANGPHEVQDRDRPYHRVLEAPGARFVKATGFTHEQIWRPEFIPYIVEAVSGLVEKVRADHGLPNSRTAR
jgi:pimeloyl-ACP methyl ester carboxylesterase